MSSVAVQTVPTVPVQTLPTVPVQITYDCCKCVCVKPGLGANCACANSVCANCAVSLVSLLRLCTGKTKPLRDRNAADAAGLHIFILQIVAAT